MIDTLKSRIQKEVLSYRGEHERFMHLLPDVYDLIIHLIDDVDLDRDLRLALMASLGYLLIPNDLYPESELGPIGYVEDSMLFLHVLRDIREKYDLDYLVVHWEKGEEELDWLLSKGFESLLDEFGDLYYQVIEYMGF